MRIISTVSLKQCQENYHQAKQPLRAWEDEVTKAKWQAPQYMKDDYRTAGFLSNKRVAFDIKGNHYRLIVAVAYRFRRSASGLLEI